MAGIEIYDNIEPEQRINIAIQHKPNPGLDNVYEKLNITHKQDDTAKVSKNVCMTDTKQKWLLLVCVMVCTTLSLTTLGFTIWERAVATDGSWSGWAHWEACSSTCDVGIQMRQRNCSNPHPSGNGRQCLGVDIEQRFCYAGSCSKTTTEMMATTEMEVMVSQLPCCEDFYYEVLPSETTTKSSQYIAVHDMCKPCGDYEENSGDYEENSGDYNENDYIYI